MSATSGRADASALEPTRAELRAERRAHARRTGPVRPPRARLAAAGALRRLADALTPVLDTSGLCAPQRQQTLQRTRP